MSKFKIMDNKLHKVIKSENFNMIFNKENGFTATWGKTTEEDPDWCPAGPIILDMEVVAACRGVRDKSGKRVPCAFCYKSNTPVGNYMNFETFKTILDKMPKTLTQIAFGVDAEANMNPDLFKMMEYSRESGIIPNLTVADIDDETADNIAKYAGACAVSYYPTRDKNRCYDTIKKLTDRGMTQVNIHCMIASESYDSVFELLKDIKTDPRLAKLNALVLLSLKQKGRGEKFNSLTQEQFKNIVDTCLKEKINFGFDSCGAGSFIRAIKNHKNFDNFLKMAEPCESTLFSSYINENGKFYPCSFAEEGEGLDVVNCKDFVKDIWHHESTKKFRDSLIGNKDENGCRACPLYSINGCDMSVK